MEMSHKYTLDTSVQVLFKDMNISAQDVLRHARLPLDLLSRKSPTVTADEYCRLWEGLAHVANDPLFPLRMVQMISVEAFSPPIFACFCSSDLNVALNRISYYKPLVGPLRLDITQDNQQTTVAFRGLPEASPPPSSLMAMELAFWVQIARLATREHIVPLAVYTTAKIPQVEEYERYLGTRIQQSTFNGVSFSAEDATKPFLTANEQMWTMFEPQLNMRMQDLEKEAKFRERVRACLMEMLASGQHSMADVASRLAVSTRTLQRRLRDENTSFQKELDNLREELARNYLSRSDYTSGQIAFLLGYDDPNSFFRAFRAWTGQTPEYVRANIQ
jgi:AraC-like DNA-binding protein